MRASRMRLNPRPRQMMWQIKQVDITDISVLLSHVKVVNTARDLGVLICQSLSAHVAALCRSVCGYTTNCDNSDQLSRPITHNGSCQNTIFHAFVSCRLDYYNSLLYCIPDNFIKKLRSVQNAAARHITRTRRIIYKRQTTRVEQAFLVQEARTSATDNFDSSS